MRFGKFSHIADPGLNFKIPFGVDKLYKVPVQRQLKEEFGFRTEDAAVRTRYSKANFLDESLMLTGDLNAAEVEWIVQYRVADPYKYLFKIRDVDSTLSGGERKRIELTGEVPSAINIPTGCRFHPRCPYKRDECSKKEPIITKVDKEHFLACHQE